MSGIAVVRTVARVSLGALLAATGIMHLTSGRRGFRMVVPDWAPRVLKMDADSIVLASGVAEIALAGALIAVPVRPRRGVGIAVALFFAAVFPGNVHQWRTHRSAPMLRTDTQRFVRLLLQPALLVWALWSTADPRVARRS